MKKLSKILLTLSVFVVLFASPAQTLAATYYHNGAGGLQDPNSWFLDADLLDPYMNVPTVGDIGVVYSVINQDSIAAIDYELQIGNGALLELSAQLTFTGSSSLKVLNNGTLNINSGGIIEMQDATDLLLEYGSILDIFDSGSLIVQTGSNLEISNGGQLRVEYGGNFTQNNTLWNVGGNLTLLTNKTIPSGKTWAINGGEVSLDEGAQLTVASGGSLEVHSGSYLTLDNGAGVIVADGGLFDVKRGGSFTIVDYNSTFAQNNPTWTINGNLNFSNDFAVGDGLSWTAASSSLISLNNTANFRVTNNASLTVLSGATFVIGEFSSFAVSLTGSFINYGTWTNNGGTVSVASSGSITNTVPSPYLLSGVVSSPITPYTLSSITSDNDTNFNAVLSQSTGVWSSSNLPTGIAINPVTGVLTGAPSTVGSGNMSISCTNSTTGSVATQFVAYRIDPIPDTTAPVISGVQVSGLTTTGATIAWSTNENASSTVSYGTSVSYGSTATSTGTTTHSVTLSGLSANTTYNFRINSTDSSLNVATTTSATFTTASESVSVGVVVSGPSAGGSSGGGGIVTFYSNNSNIKTTAVLSNPILNKTINTEFVGLSPQTVSVVVEKLGQHKNTFITSTGTPFVFTKDLNRNTVVATDAKKLQVFLNSVGFPVSNRGSGSLGLENTRFGPQTRAALARFQKSVGITPALGNFGPITRGYINKMISAVVEKK